MRVPTVFVLSGLSEYHEVEASRRLKLLGFPVLIAPDPNQLVQTVRPFIGGRNTCPTPAQLTVAPDGSGTHKAAKMLVSVAQNSFVRSRAHGRERYAEDFAKNNATYSILGGDHNMTKSFSSLSTPMPAESDFTKPSGRIISLLSFATMFVIGTDTFVIAPLLPTLSEQFHISMGVSGWLISAYAIGYALCALVAGPISDGRDRRGVLLAGLVGFIVMTALCGFAQGFWTMFFFRFLAGVSAAFVTPQIWASIPVLVKPERIVRTMGSATAGLAIAQVAGIPLGAWLAVISWHMTFWAISGAAIVLWIILIKRFPPVPSRPSGSQHRIFSTYGLVLRNRTLVLYLLAYLVFQTGNFEAISFFGSWFHKDYGLGVRAIGFAMMVLGIGFAIGSLFGSHLVQRLGQYRALFLALVSLTVLYCVLPFSANLSMVLVILSLIMTVAGFVFPIFMSTLQAQTEAARGTVSSLANAAM